MPRPIAKRQFSNNILVSGKGKPLTVDQETHFMERHDSLTIGSSLNLNEPSHSIDRNEKGQSNATSCFIAENVGSDWWTVGSHHPQDWWTHDRMRITRRQGRGYKRQAGRSPKSFHPQPWNVKPLNLPPCPQDANDAE